MYMKKQVNSQSFLSGCSDMEETVNMSDVLNSVYGKKVCRVAVGKHNKLSIGIGEKVYHGNSRLKNNYYGEYEIGTYYGDWRIIREKKILLSSADKIDFKTLNEKINKIQLDEVTKITSSQCDVQVTFRNGTTVEIIATPSDDEVFHIFCPDNVYAEFTTAGIWKIGKSNAPWKD